MEVLHLPRRDQEEEADGSEGGGTGPENKLATGASLFVAAGGKVMEALEAYGRFGVEEQVDDIMAESCKLPAACDESVLGDGIQFSNRATSLSRDEDFEADASQPSKYTSSTSRSVLHSPVSMATRTPS